eukprot:12815154-Alexandrium_andersonii.AAC.1
MRAQIGMLRNMLRTPAVRQLLKVRSDVEIVKGGPSEMQQRTQGGMSAGVVNVALQQHEEVPQSKHNQNKTANSETRTVTSDRNYEGL